VTLPFAVDSSACLEPTLGPDGLPRAAFEEDLAALAATSGRLAKARADGSLPILQLPDRRDDLEAARDLVASLSENCSEIVILGTGGSSLGGQTINALADQGFGPPKGRPKLHFFDNVDPHTFDIFLERTDRSRLGVVAISKSGTTAETLCQTAILLDALRETVDEARLAGHVAVITEPKASPLKALAERFRLPCLDHDPKVGGRFSALSVVGAVPALMAGLDVAALREGAGAVLDAALAAGQPDPEGPAGGAAIAVGLSRLRGVSQSVIMPYVDRLAFFGLWYRQLWAESLGKQGRGTTPIRAMGTVDQHSQVQLYLGGPKDKHYTLLRLATAGTGGRVEPELADDPSLDYLAGRTMGDLLEAEARATGEALIRNGRPTRWFLLDRLDEAVLGGLMMHFELETIYAADLFGVDPFDQPAVEEGKGLTREYLRAGPA